MPPVDRRILAGRVSSLSAILFPLVLMAFGGSVFLMPFYFDWLQEIGT